MDWQVAGDRLTLSANGGQIVYTRRGGTRGAAAPSGAKPSPGGIIAPEIVGTWAWTDTSSTNSGGISSSTYVVLRADGSYEYHSEGSISATTQDFSAGTASQSSDSGSWRLEGSVLHVQSRSYGAIDYSFEKRNHPKTGDPMIVLNGQPFVTYYQKQPWR